MNSRGWHEWVAEEQHEQASSSVCAEHVVACERIKVRPIAGWNRGKTRDSGQRRAPISRVLHFTTSHRDRRGRCGPFHNAQEGGILTRDFLPPAFRDIAGIFLVGGGGSAIACGVAAAGTGGDGGAAANPARPAVPVVFGAGEGGVGRRGGEAALTRRGRRPALPMGTWWSVLNRRWPTSMESLVLLFVFLVVFSVARA